MKRTSRSAQMIRNWLLINIAAMLTFFVIGLCINNKCYALDLNITEGTSYTKRAPNGIWWQAGMPYKYQLAANSRNIAVGGWYNDWLRIEGNYLDFGQIGGSLKFVSDENYSGNEKDPCRQPCEAPRSAKWTGASKAFGASIMPTYRYNGNFIGFRIGASRHNTRTYVTTTNFKDNMVDDPATNTIGYYNMSHRGFSWYYGGQLKIKEQFFKGTVQVIYLHAPDVRSGYDGFQRGIKDIHLTYTLRF